MLAMGAFSLSGRSNNAYKLEKWQSVEADVTSSPLSQSYIDSVSGANNMVFLPAGREVEHPLKDYQEKIVYEAGWGPFNAGFGILTITPRPIHNNIIFSFTGATNAFVSAFYEVRDLIISTMDYAGLYPHIFEEHIQEGRYRALRWVFYDHKNSRAYTNKKGHEQEDITPFTLDYLSLLYNLRGRTLMPPDTFSIDCFVHGKNYNVFFRCTKRETIKIKTGTYRCVLVEPRLVGKGRNFSEKDKITIWLTDDRYHVPVQVKSKIKIGSVVGEMIYYKRERITIPQKENQ